MKAGVEDTWEGVKKDPSEREQCGPCFTDASLRPREGKLPPSLASQRDVTETPPTPGTINSS